MLVCSLDFDPPASNAIMPELVERFAVEGRLHLAGVFCILAFCHFLIKYLQLVLSGLYLGLQVHY